MNARGAIGAKASTMKLYIVQTDGGRILSVWASIVDAQEHCATAQGQNFVIECTLNSMRSPVTVVVEPKTVEEPGVTSC